MFNENIFKQKKNAFLEENNPYFKAYKLNISNDLTKTFANVLHPPSIEYLKKTYDFINDKVSWAATDFKMTKDVTSWVVISANNSLLIEVVK